MDDQKRNRVRRIVLGAVLVLVLFLGSAEAAAQSSPANGLRLRTWTVDSGGAIHAAGGGLTLSATVGQPDAASPAVYGAYTLLPGFWPGGAAKYKAYLPVLSR